MFGDYISLAKSPRNETKNVKYHILEFVLSFQCLVQCAKQDSIST